MIEYNPNLSELLDDFNIYVQFYTYFISLRNYKFL